MNFQLLKDIENEDINDEMNKRAMRFQPKGKKATLLSTSAFQNSNSGGCDGAGCCMEEFTEDDIIDEKIDKTKTKWIGGKESIDAFNHFNGADGGSQPVDAEAMADGMIGAAAGGDGGCCGGESLHMSNIFAPINEGYYYTLFREEKYGKVREYTSPCYETREECESCAQEDIQSFNDYDGEEPIKLSYEISECNDRDENQDSEEKDLTEDINKAESFDMDQINRISHDLNNYLRDHECYTETYPSTDGLNNPVIQADIDWGDWKHEHLRFKSLVDEFMQNQGYDFLISEEVTEDDGSDTYSAIHTISDIRPVVIDDLKSTNEALTESMIHGSLRENLKRLDAESDNKYDLVQFYDSLSLIWDSMKKKKVYDMLYGKNAAEDIYKFLSKEFEEVV